MTERVTIDLADGVADVRFARPDKVNALDAVQFAAIVDAIDRLAAMRGVRCVVLSGEGKGFCAGLDLDMFAGGDLPDLMPRTHGVANNLQQAAWGWRTLPMPVIAAVHGVAFGAGFQIMMGADIRLAAPDAQLSVMEARWGLAPDLAGIALFRGTVRDDIARELTYTGRTFSGVEAAQLGVVTRTDDNPYEAAMTMARAIAANSPAAVRADKRLFNLSADGDTATILQAESREQSTLLSSPDHHETLAAAHEKRAPVFHDL